MLLKIDRKMLLVKNALEYCLKLMNSGKCTRKIGGILRDHGGKWVLITRIWNRVMNFGTGSQYPIPAWLHVTS